MSFVFLDPGPLIDHELELESGFGSEFFQIKIPLPHLIDIGQRFPNFRDRRVQRSFDNNCIC